MNTAQKLLLLSGKRAAASAPSFSPTDIAGLVHYLASEYGTYQDNTLATPAVADADAVGGWLDKSTSAKPVLQATAGNKLQLKLNILNGYPAVRSVGSPRRLTSAAITINQPFTMIVMVKTNSNFGEVYGDASANLLRGNAVFSITAGTSRAGTTPATGYQVVTAVFNGASSFMRVNRYPSLSGLTPGAGSLAAINVASAGNPETMDAFRMLIYNSALSATDYGKVEDYLFKFYGARYFLVVGDSKSTYGQYDWRDQLRVLLETATSVPWAESGPPIAAAGRTVADMRNAIDAGLAACWVTPEFVFINIGVNTDASNEATWKANYQYTIDAIAAKYPAAKILISKVWRRSVDLTTVNTWIGDIIALNAPRAVLADNESIWLEGGDNGVTMTVEGIHYSATGLSTKAGLEKTAMGF